jgi:NDP-sugar pyrophosphorylase family protein
MLRSMILAAGLGTRLRPITYFLPKPLVPVRNKPLIAYAVENYLRAGVEEIVVNLHHLPELIERYLTLNFDCKFHFSYEPTILGTGGALRRVRHLLDDDFFLVNGDTIQSPPFDALRRARNGFLAALTLRHPPAHDKFTPVYFENGRITGFGSGTGEPLMFSGAHAIGAEIFDRLPEKDVFSIVDDVYRGVPLAGVVDDGPWFDIGTPQRYLEAHGGQALSPVQRGGEDGQAKRLSSIGARTVVEGVLNDSVVWDDCHIARGVVLHQCIVANGVEIEEPAEITRAIICRDHPAIPAEYERRNGLVISPFSM